MGVVYAARDPVLARDVAVKLIPPGILSEETETRFRREAQILAAMDHPCIVGIYDAGKFEDALYIVMPLVRGETLRHRLAKGRLQLGEMLEIAIQTTDALEYSHSKGVVHRDIKPENILLTQGEREAVRVRITDFGLAIAPANDRLTRSGAVVGTAA
jgi:eukaryotic-like serine/threonine-protein kinase